jgi:DNA-binding transcriptional LysR family regulator
MHLEQLESFLEIAKRGALNRAAQARYVNQPTLTARLQSLERELGEKLFVRSPRGMRLTEYGRIFLPYAARAVRSLQAGREALDGVRSANAGRLVIGAATAVSSYVLPDILKRFARKHPKVEIAVRTGHSEDVLNMVINDEVQVGLMRTIVHPDVQTWPFYQEELVLVVAPQHRFAKRRSVNASALAGEQLILFDRTSSYYELTQAFFLSAGVQPRAVMELDNIEAAKRMVERRLGVALVPRSAAARDIAARRLAHVRLAGVQPVTQRIVIAQRRDLGTPTGVTAAFLELARAAR